ncbi:MAG: DUF1501 domain-containing protein [Algicola sp.]|nr:DUF1501 domain-containing protein [Algicola sp.]
MKRRDFIKTLGASLVVFQTAPLVNAAQLLAGKKAKKPKVIWIVLRGAMDSLHTIVPTFDPALAKLRPSLYSGIKDQLLMLDRGYALHPALTNLHQWYQEQQLLPIVAVSSGYQKRSHFDGQDFLESGLSQINHDSGWLGRAAELKQTQALAVARSTPISLRSANNVNTWYPSKLKDADTDTYQALMALYQYDELLLKRLQQGLSTQKMAGASLKNLTRQGKFANLTKACAKLMVGDNGVDCAMLELTGWDTHNNQQPRIARQLKQLDHGLGLLKEGLGQQWQYTVVIVATEFGRTAMENGTKGTDHGTASAMFIAGGAVKGGRVLGQWPGLASEQLFEQRDLMPTSNTFSWIANILATHWAMSDQQIKQIFPDIAVIKQQLIT